MSDKVKVFLVMLVAILLAAAGEALAAKGMKAATQTDGNGGGMSVGEQIRAVVGSGHVWVGLVLMVGYVLFYIYALGMAELSFTVPLSAASYLLGTLAGKFYLHEEVKPARWIGTGVIVLGVLIVAIWGQNSGDRDESGQEPSSSSAAPDTSR